MVIDPVGRCLNSQYQDETYLDRSRMLGVYKVIDFQLAVSLAMTVLRGDVSNPLRASLSIRFILFFARLRLNLASD